MQKQKITRLNTALAQKAMDDVFKKNNILITNDQMGELMPRQMFVFAKEDAMPEIRKGQLFLATNKLRKEVTTLPSGLQYEILKKSDSAGIKPKAIDTVVVNYVGTLVDGVTEVDNSIKRGKPAKFVADKVIQGWTDILQMMIPGDKYKIYVPTELGYYLNPRDPNKVPPGAALIFEIELLEVHPTITAAQ